MARSTPTNNANTNTNADAKKATPAAEKKRRIRMTSTCVTRKGDVLDNQEEYEATEESLAIIGIKEGRDFVFIDAKDTSDESTSDEPQAAGSQGTKEGEAE